MDVSAPWTDGNEPAEEMRQHAARLSTAYCRISPEILTRVRDGQGHLFNTTTGHTPLAYALDLLDPRRALDQAQVLAPFVGLTGKKVLEIGCGCGISHVSWTKAHGIDGWGIEPAGESFDDSADIARSLVRTNGLDPNRIVNAVGEALPFADKTFDIVYSTNVLEHTNNPKKVLHEAIRVLKPGGILQVVCPNYFSYFDGHYVVFHPPILSNRFFQFWVKWITRRDPSFAATIRTEINPFWVRRTLAAIAKTIPLRILTLGQTKFVERMSTADIPRATGLGVIARIVRIARLLRISRVAARVVVWLQGWTPLIITVTRER